MRLSTSPLFFSRRSISGVMHAVMRSYSGKDTKAAVEPPVEGRLSLFSAAVDKLGPFASYQDRHLRLDKGVLDVALEMTRVSLGLTDDLANGIITKQIVELAKAGERHPDF